jgi:two-component system cell cycle sensor histidine kinase/response regulator CckA
MIVDDEPDVLRLLQTLLAQEGFEVVTAKNADAAVRVFERLAQPPDLLVVDVVMPGMSGPMLVDHLRGLNPDLKVLFMSGYGDSRVVRQYVIEKGFHLVTKPFTIQSFRNAVDVATKGSRAVGRKGPAR